MAMTLNNDDITAIVAGILAVEFDPINFTGLSVAEALGSLLANVGLTKDRIGDPGEGETVLGDLGPMAGNISTLAGRLQVVWQLATLELRPTETGIAWYAPGDSLIAHRDLVDGVYGPLVSDD